MEPSECGWQLWLDLCGRRGARLAVAPGPTPGSWTGFLKSTLWWNTLLSHDMRMGVEGWRGTERFYLNLVCQTLLTPRRRPYPLWGVNRGWERGGGCGRTRRRGNRGWYIKWKINFLTKKKERKEEIPAWKRQKKFPKISFVVQQNKTKHKNQKILSGSPLAMPPIDSGAAFAFQSTWMVLSRRVCLEPWFAWQHLSLIYTVKF